jgi:hypothetical protein
MINAIDCKDIDEVHNLWTSLNPLPHKARLSLIDVHPQIISAKPRCTNIEHLNTHPINFWVSLFESYGFNQVEIPEDILIFDNPLHIFSLNALMFEKEQNESS